MYTFVYVALEKIPSIKDWKLVITPDNLIEGIGITKPESILEEANDKWLDSYANFYFGERHINLDVLLKDKNANETSLFFSIITHPSILAGQRSDGIIKQLLKGDSVYINRNGGWCPAKGFVVLETITSEKMIFPKNEQADERIYIGRWPGGNHYYLTSNLRGRIFDKNRFFTIESAMNEAVLYVDKNKITVRPDSFAYKHSGD